ncbi:MAG: META domain-containing protein [Cyanobacteria bacterium REEB459]|nr:META domain-containing protein [Cyanobacteria bacterium REEB459]
MKALNMFFSVSPVLATAVVAGNLLAFGALLSACKNPGVPMGPNPGASSAVTVSAGGSPASAAQSQPHWRLSSWTHAGKPVALLAGLDISLKIATKEQRINGFSGCNQFGGTYHLVGDLMVVDPLRATRRACDGPIMAQEETFLAALQQVNQMNLKAGERLTLTYGEKTTAGSLVFAPQ